MRDYKWALGHAHENLPRACVIFKDLAATARFPAHDLAQVRALEACPGETFASFNRAQLPSWMQGLALDALLSRAAARADKNAEMDLAAEKAKQKMPQSEKLKWMGLALKRAGDLERKDKQQKFNLMVYAMAPRLNPKPGSSGADLLNIAGDWRQAREFEHAREFYQKVLSHEHASTDEKIQALKGRRQSYRNARQNEKHLAAAQSLIDFLKPLPTKIGAYYEAQVYRARALWTLGRSTETKTILSRLERAMKGKASRAELYWLKGRMAEENQDFAAVSKNSALALKEHFSDPDLRDKVMWYNAWNERRQSHWSNAIAALDELGQKTQQDFTRQRVQYWLGKTYADNHQEIEAQTVWHDLVEQDPLGYYGLLAQRELRQPISLPKGAAGALPTSVSPLPLDETLARWLANLDERDALNDYLDEVSLAYHKSPQQNDEAWVIIFKNYARAGLYTKLFESLGGLTPQQRVGIFARHPDLLFPRPWNAEVKAAATQFGVDESLIYAIMRQESAFDPRARSPADAFGLLQLIPEIAGTIARKYHEPFKNMDDLYDPQTNINLGAAHLKNLFHRHQNRFILSVAAYNANENVIRAWLKARYRGNALEFIEEIPYDETRAYVRLVMRNLIFYSLLKSPSGTLVFPEWVLKLDPAP